MTRSLFPTSAPCVQEAYGTVLSPTALLHSENTAPPEPVAPHLGRHPSTTHREVGLLHTSTELATAHANGRERHRAPESVVAHYVTHESHTPLEDYKTRLGGSATYSYVTRYLGSWTVSITTQVGRELRLSTGYY